MRDRLFLGEDAQRRANDFNQEQRIQEVKRENQELRREIEKLKRKIKDLEVKDV
jgi:cell division protein FtsB